MGCFLNCFGAKKECRRRKLNKRVIPKDQRIGCNESAKRVQLLHNVPPCRNVCEESGERVLPVVAGQREACDEPLQRTGCDEPLCPAISLSQDLTEKAETPIVESSDKLQEQLSFGTRKKVTFDLNVKTYEETSTHEIRDYESEEEKESEDKKEERDESSIIMQRHGSETPLAEKEVNSPLPLSRTGPEEMKTLSSNQNTRDRSQYVHSVLNPVENLAQWKVVKKRSKPPLIQQKENTNLDQELQIPFSLEPIFKVSPCSSSPKSDWSKSPKEELVVDASLSNWLGSSETTPSTKTSNLSIGNESAERSMSQRSNSPRSHEDRPILGALTVEELIHFSATSSPRKSPSRSLDEMPILGTVGSYWSHTGQAVDSSSSGSSYKGIPNTTSKYREDKRVNWHSTPFETRLERALIKGEAYAS
ncbi:hypothetical protein IFM89_000526 [Coptis chinensis]|uniref:Uncharacterized protein n=1 Tax=Coptis chinensis TaxID=261450 RepID=A0A835LKT5_9MAGN|nr:hypothetical protein IFM89_000526 [Coptis chinensis]